MVKTKRGKGKKKEAASLPSEAQILEFVQNSTGRIGKREIARAFNIKGPDKVGLKQLGGVQFYLGSCQNLAFTSTELVKHFKLNQQGKKKANAP